MEAKWKNEQNVDFANPRLVSKLKPVAIVEKMIH